MLRRLRRARWLAFLLALANPSFVLSLPAIEPPCHTAESGTDAPMPGMNHHSGLTAPAGQPTLQGAPGHDCPHCPPADCATAPSCSSAGVVAFATGSGRWIRDDASGASIASPSERYDSVTLEGPTPPPQRIL